MATAKVLVAAGGGSGGAENSGMEVSRYEKLLQCEHQEHRHEFDCECEEFEY